MTLQTSRAICGTNRDRTALMYSTFRAEKQKQCPKKSGDAGEGIGNYVSPNRVLRRNRFRALPEPERDEKDSTVSSSRAPRRNRVRTLTEPERDERNSTVSPNRAPRRNRVRTLPEPERDERDQRNLCRHSSRFCRPTPLASASVPLSLPPGRIDPLPTAAREGRAGDRQGLLATSSV